VSAYNVPVRILRGRGRGRIGRVLGLTGLSPYVSKVPVEGVPGIDLVAIADLEPVTDSRQLSLDLDSVPGVTIRTA
jgi:hypothetical protein